MRFLSEDGKLFNTEAECKEHEAEINRTKKEDERKKEQEQDIKNLAKMMAEVTEMMDKVNIATEAYEKKWGVNFGESSRLGKKNDDLGSLLKFLL